MIAKGEVMTARTYGQLHFTDLDATRFEMLIMQIVYRMRRWERIEHTGAAGADAGIDIRAIEILENGKRVTHHFQCKRYEKITKSQIESIIHDYVQSNKDPADYYYLVCGCNPSKIALDAFGSICKEVGIRHYDIWSASLLEAMLYTDYHDLLFAYFGINILNQHNSTVSAIRRNIELKKRLHKDFDKIKLSDAELRAIRYEGEYWRRFVHSEVLICSIYDKNYPENYVERPGYFKAELFNWYHNGIEVHAYPYAIDAKVKRVEGEACWLNEAKMKYEVIEERLEVYGCIPFEAIVAYDMDGDEYYNIPHIYCDYISGADPYEEIRYRDETGLLVPSENVIEIL